MISLLLTSLLGTLAALKLLKGSIGGLGGLGNRAGSTLLLEHISRDTGDFTGLGGGLLGATLLGLLLKSSLLVNTTVLHSPLGGKVATLHEEARGGLAGDESEHLLVETDEFLSVARVDPEAAVVAKFGLDHHLK